MSTLLNVFCILFFLSAQAQERKRIVVDLETNKRIPYATIKVLHTTQGQIASVNGEFTVNVTANDTVLITCVGYRDTFLIGKEISNTVALTPRPEILETVIVKTKKVISRFIIGNGADLIEKNIKCKYVPGGQNDCLPWGAGAAAEFAEPMMLPDSHATYRLSKVYIPVGKHACWQPVFLQIYGADSITGNPGNLILRKYLLIQPENYRKGKVIMDLSKDNLYFRKMNHFFISISWDTNFPNEICATTIVLVKSVKGICYNRNLQSSDYRWALFDADRFQNKEGHFSTIFAAEIEELED